MNFLPAHLEPSQVSRSFNRAVITYQDHARLQKIVAEILLEKILCVKFSPPQHILDVGTGSGQLIHALTQHYPNAQIYGIDISINMLRYSQQRFAKPYFIKADAAQLPFANDSIDLLISNLTLQWCNDIATVFSEFARVLTPNGALFFSTLGPDTLIELRQSWATVDNASHVNEFFDMHQLGDALMQIGFTHPVMDIDRLQLDYSQVYQLMKELKAIGAHNITAGRPKTLMGKQKIQAMINAYEKYRLANGQLPASYEVIYGHAWGKKSLDTKEFKIHFKSNTT
jgi:malonyl-CoA O-methyltransferase